MSEQLERLYLALRKARDTQRKMALRISYLERKLEDAGVTDFERETFKEVASIALVEDDADIAEFYREMLTLNGYEVSIAANGSDLGKQLVKGLEPDLIISDLEMPDVDGHKIIEFLRSGKLTQRIPLAVVSGRIDDVAQELLEEHQIPYRHKPVTEQDLLELITEGSQKR